jgi:hypothetical protein
MQVAPAHPSQIPFHFFPKSSSLPSLIPPVVVKKRVVPVPLRAPRATPRPLDDLHERKPSQAVISANVLASPPSPRESPLPRSPNVGRSAHAPLTRVTRLRHPHPLTHASRQSFPLHRRHAHLRNRSPTSLPPSTRSGSRSFSVRPTTDETIPRECHIDEDAVLDDTFLSSEKVVLGIMKSYVQCKS